MIKEYIGSWISEVWHTTTATVKQTTNMAPNHHPGIYKKEKWELGTVQYKKWSFDHKDKI